MTHEGALLLAADQMPLSLVSFYSVTEPTVVCHAFVTEFVFAVFFFNFFCALYMIS